MMNGLHATYRKYNGFVSVLSRNAAIPTISEKYIAFSRVCDTGFFIAAIGQRFAFRIQRLVVSVFEYSVISLVRNAANKRFQLLKKVYKRAIFV